MSSYSLLSVVLSQVYLSNLCNGLSTYPVSQDGQTPVIAAVEGAMNVMVFCEVTFENNTVFTTWQLTKVGELRFPLAFDINGTGTNSENFIATGVPIGNEISRSNLTILTFDSSLDMALLQCGLGNTVLANFTLRIVSKLFCK